MNAVEANNRAEHIISVMSSIRGVLDVSLGIYAGPDDQETVSWEVPKSGISKKVHTDMRDALVRGFSSGATLTIIQTLEAEISWLDPDENCEFTNDCIKVFACEIWEDGVEAFTDDQMLKIHRQNAKDGLIKHRPGISFGNLKALLEPLMRLETP